VHQAPHYTRILFPALRYETAVAWETRSIYHDGCFATLRDVVDHYDRHFATRLSGQDKADLIEFLKSL